MYISEESDFTSNEFNILRKILKEPEEDVQKLISLIHKRDEKQLKNFKEREEGFRSLIEQTTDAVFCYEFSSPIPVDLSIDEQVKLMYNCVLVDCNLICAQSYGFDKVEDIIGRKLTDLFGTLPGSLNKLFRNMVESGYQIVDGLGIEKIPGDVDRYYLNNGYGVIENGKLQRIWGTFRDITRRKIAEQELRESEQFLKRAQRVAHIGHFSLNVDTLKVFGSDELFDIFGLTQEEATLEAFITVDHPDDREFDLHHINRGLEYGESWDIEHRLVTKNGAEKWVHAIGEVIKDEKGKVIMLIGTVQDITDRKNAEEELKESVEKYRNLINNIHEVIFELDEKGNVIYMSPQVYEITGYRPEEQIGSNLKDLIHPDDLNLTLTLFSKLITSGEVQSADFRRKHKDGHFIYVNSTGRRVKIGDNYKIVGVTRDITKRKIAEQQLKDSEEELRKLNKDLEQKVQERTIELKQSEEKWRALSENSPAHVMLLDKDQIIQFINRTVPDLMVDEVIGTSIYDYTPLEYRKVAVDCSRQVWQTGKPCSYITKYFTSDNVTRYFEVRIGPVFQFGKVVALISHSLDITESKNSEQALKKREYELEERLKELTCLYSISRLVELNNISIKQIVSDTLDLIPPAWQFPEITCARITYDGYINSTKNYSKTEWSQKSEIKVNNEVVGEIEINYLKEKPRKDEGPFIKEERDLINALAEILGRFFERKKADQMLQESESKLKSIISAIPDQINIMDKDFNIIFCNDLVEELYGPNVLGNKCYEIFHGFSAVCDNCYVVNTLKDGKIRDDECVRIDKDGNKHDCWCISNVATVDDKGDPLTILEISRDITEKKIAEKKLRESEERFRALSNVLEQKVEERTNELKESEEKYRLIFDNSPIGIGISNKAGEVITINKKMEELTQFTLEEINNLGLESTYVDPNERSNLLKILEETGMAKDYELRLKRADGTPYLALLNINLIEFGGEMFIHTNMMDITERRTAEIKLKESEEKIQNLINNISDVLLEAEPSGILTYISPQIYNIIEYHSEELVGLNFMDFVHLDDKNRFKEMATEALQTKKVVSIDCRFKHKRGYYVPISARWSVVEVNNELKVFGLVSDNTERKNIDDMMKREVRQLKKIDQIKTDLINRISHELNTPLVSILSASDILLTYFIDDINEGALEYVNIIQSGGYRLKDIVDNLLVAFRLESEEIKLDLRKVNIISLLKGIIEDNVYFAQSRNIMINIEMQKELYLKIDKSLIHIVLSNVISNAIKNTLPKGNVFVKTVNHHKYIEICVEDTGVGLTKKEMTILFKKFGKIERYGKGLDVDIEGPGLGLYISNEILKLHNSEIIVESKGRNKGSKFIIRLVKS